MLTNTSSPQRNDGEAPSVEPTTQRSSIKVIARPARLGPRGQRYVVLLDGNLLIADTLDPMTDASRLLSFQGYTGRLEIWDEVRPYPLMIVLDLQAAARLVVSETEQHGPRFRPYRRFPSSKLGLAAKKTAVGLPAADA